MMAGLTDFALWRILKRLRVEGTCLVWPHGQPVVRVRNKVWRVRALLRHLVRPNPRSFRPCNRQNCVTAHHGRRSVAS